MKQEDVFCEIRNKHREHGLYLRLFVHCMTELEQEPLTEDEFFYFLYFPGGFRPGKIRARAGQAFDGLRS